MSKSPRVQSRNFSCVSYLTREQLHDVFVRKSSQIKHYAYILHDSDVEQDGTPKAPHFHIILCLTNNVNLSTCTNWFKGYRDSKDQLVNTLVQPTNSVTGCYRYLTHKDDPEKFQYNECLITATDPSYFEDERQCEGDPVWGYVEMILNGVPLREVAQIGGRDFIYHYSAIRLMVDDIKREEESIVNRESYKGLRENVTAFMNGEDIAL